MNVPTFDEWLKFLYREPHKQKGIPNIVPKAKELGLLPRKSTDRFRVSQQALEDLVAWAIEQHERDKDV